MEHIYIHPYGTDKMFHGIINSKKTKASTYCKKHGFEPNLWTRISHGQNHGLSL